MKRIILSLAFGLSIGLMFFGFLKDALHWPDHEAFDGSFFLAISAHLALYSFGLMVKLAISEEKK